MAEDTTGYNANNVSLGKPGVKGVLYRAPYGTTLPGDAVEELDAAFKSVGYIGEDGITNATDSETTDINDMGGTRVLSAISSYAETYQFVMIETNAESLKARYGDDNVKTDEQGRPTSVDHKVDDGTPSTWVKEILMTGGTVKRTVIPNGTRVEFGDLVEVGTDAIGYDMTISANPDERIGEATSRDYFAYTSSPAGVNTLMLSRQSGGGTVGDVDTFTVDVAPGGADSTPITVTSQNDGVATASVDGNTVNVQLVGEGETTLTVRAGEKTAMYAVNVTAA
ncbi:hypothetical protein [Bifidobacterium phasiani]|uniref:BIG2 domain-containing protein n=1 Tax=Bifidobacterium phasiani TaxID=2834431 RepID=A0ABS6W6H8_9BIFI|nr:hypothetical protein [Bifidobacterium phasiani]MBW3081967.1 hypothetical protein [Bifidobacterium phasiani]